MEIIYKKDKCIKCRMCVSLCPEYWGIKDGKILLIGSKKTKIGSKLEIKKIKCNKIAEEMCPMQCISIESTV